MTDAERLAAFARGYRIPLIDYSRPSSGLLVSSGAGCMMAAMDSCPALRWCLDIDQLAPESRLAQFLAAAEHLARPIAVLGWFSITDPVPLRAALAGLSRVDEVLVYVHAARLPGGKQCASLLEFERALCESPTGV
jgi:hypothetical protein